MPAQGHPITNGARAIDRPLPSLQPALRIVAARVFSFSVLVFMAIYLASTAWINASYPT